MSPQPQTTPIAFIGLGAMGFGMATHLLHQGYPVVGYDVYEPTRARFVDARGRVADSLSESVRGCDYVVVMVASAVQAEEVLFGEKGIVKAMENQATLILASTVPASYARSVQSNLTLSRPDISFIDAPVSGGALRAANGTLSIMAGASDSALERGKFLLSELADANKLYLVPGGVGAGSNMKMVHQVLAAVQILAASEAMGLAARLGLDATRVKDEVITSDAWSWMFENRVGRMLSEDYVPGVSALTIILKDVGIITSSTRALAFPTPLCSTAEQIYLTGLRLGYGPHDDAGMVRLYFPDPIPKVTSSASDDEAGTETKKINLVLALLRAIHLCAAAEALSLAKFLNVDLDMYYRLVCDAAGGSAMFRAYAPGMVGIKSVTNGHDGVKGRSLGEMVSEMVDVVDKAREVNAPLHLGGAVLAVLMGARRRFGEGEGVEGVVRMWE